MRTLIRENPWATIISTAGGELVASHYPVLLDETLDGIELLIGPAEPCQLVIVQQIAGRPSLYRLRNCQERLPPSGPVGSVKRA